MSKLLDENGILPYKYYQKTLQDLTEIEWGDLPPEAQLATLFADFGILSDNNEYYEFIIPKNEQKIMVEKLFQCAKQLDVEVHSSAKGAVHAVKRLADVDEILEYFC